MRPARREHVHGIRCVQLVGEQESDWDRPAIHHPGWRRTETVWLGGSFAFSWYVGHLAHYARTYGSLATMVGFLMWIWLGLMIVLFGAELNCELGRVRPK